MDLGDRFLNGHLQRALLMPDGCHIFTVDFDPPATRQDVFNGNRNVFRLAEQGGVVWQVTRIDRPHTDWEFKRCSVRNQGLPRWIEPFTRFPLVYPDGSVNRAMPWGVLADAVDWVAGCEVRICSLGTSTQLFSLDVRTGMAVKVASKEV
ncbi:hypothetical protein [Variovorax sp. PvP013]|uniref:hypothetical protein n=1 Tax=Variovorax sp. PvP013 TaxID=3156435 RepID=UPI003D22EF2F